MPTHLTINMEENDTEESMFQEDVSNEDVAVPQEYMRIGLASTPMHCSDINDNFRITSQGMRSKKNILRDRIIEESFQIPGRNMENGR